MSCSRRQFIARTGGLIAITSVTGQVVAQTLNINGVRYGMVHDESLYIGCNAYMAACRDVNQVPEWVSRLTIRRSEPIGVFPDVKYRFFRHSCQHCDNPPCVDVCPTGRHTAMRQAVSSMSILHCASVVSTVLPLVLIRCALFILRTRPRTSAIFAARPI